MVNSKRAAINHQNKSVKHNQKLKKDSLQKPCRIATSPSKDPVPVQQNLGPQLRNVSTLDLAGRLTSRYSNFIPIKPC